MPSFPAHLHRMGWLLARHSGRLRAALERLAVEVRAAVARAVGQATGEAIREALAVILDGPPRQLDYPGQFHDREGGWGTRRQPTWPATRPYEPYDPAPYAGDPYEPDLDGPDDQPARRYADEDDPPNDESATARRPGAWARAVAAGCQAAAWWLRRRPGPFALVAAAGIGLAAGVVALVGSPLAAGASAVAAAALGLLALADAAGLADQALN